MTVGDLLIYNFFLYCYDFNISDYYMGFKSRYNDLWGRQFLLNVDDYDLELLEGNYNKEECYILQEYFQI